MDGYEPPKRLQWHFFAFLKMVTNPAPRRDSTLCIGSESAISSLVYLGGTVLRSPDWNSSIMTRSEQSICGCGYVPRYGTLCFDVVAIEISSQVGA